MKIVKRLVGDVLLVGVLFSLLFLPFGTVGLSGVNKKEVLSETTYREELPSTTQNTINSPDLTNFSYPYENPQYFRDALTNTAQSSSSKGQEVDNSQNKN